MKVEVLKQRLDRNRPMSSVTIRIPEDVIEDLKRVASLLGFSGYQPLIRAYIGQGLRVDLEPNDPMLTLEQLISEATALPDAAKTLLIDKIVESMTEQVDRDILMEGVNKAQERIAEIDHGVVQTISGDIALEQIQQLSKK